MENIQRIRTIPAGNSQRNIMHIVEQGLQLRQDVKTMKHHFNQLLDSNKHTEDPIYSLLRKASDQLQSPMLGTNAISLRKHAVTPIKSSGGRIVSTTPLPSLAGKRKCSTASDFLSIPKMPRFDSPDNEECKDNDINENKENEINSVSTSPALKKLSKRRRSSLKRFLTPKRRKSESTDAPQPKMPRMGVRAKLAGFTNVHNFQGCTNVQDSETSDVHIDNFNSLNKRPAVEGGCNNNNNSSGSVFQSTMFSLNNDTIQTAELSSQNYSCSPKACDMSNKSIRPTVKEAIKSVAGQFLPNDTGKSPMCSNNNNNMKKSAPLKNRINVSDLLSESDTSVLKCKEVMATSEQMFGGSDGFNDISKVQNDNKSFSDISNLSDISQSHHQTMREQLSMNNIVIPGALHSTFNYPLHSTMNFPLSSTIIDSLDQPNKLTTDIPEFCDKSVEDSDCDSSVMSVDVDEVDDLSFTVDNKMLGGNCDVCKVLGMRRQMAQPKLDVYRRPPIGLTQTEIQYESRFPRFRLPPVGASQSFLDAEKTMVNAADCSSYTIDATIGSIPDMSSLTELEETVLMKTHSKVSSSRMGSTSSQQKKHRRRTMAVEIDLEDKENMNFFQRGSTDARRKPCRSRQSIDGIKTPMYPDYTSDYSISSNIDSSTRKMLKKKMKSFNASQRSTDSSSSSSVATLGFF